jgi:hypothetical protein
MKTKILYLGLFLAGLIIVNPCSGQITSDSALASKAYRSLKKAGALNGLSLAFGIASNIEMAAIGGFPLQYDGGMNPAVNVSHAILCTGRISFSVFPPVNVAKARKTLKPWRESPEMASSCRKLFSSLDAAQVLTAAAPVLCVAGGIMMFAGSQGQYETTYDDYHPSTEFKLKNPGLRTIGWVCVAAGLASSISAAILIGDAKKELSRKMGTLKMTAGPSGLGLIYNLPVQGGNRRHPATLQ